MPPNTVFLWLYIFWSHVWYKWNGKWIWVNSKHFAECVYMCAVGVLEFQALGCSVCSKTGGQLDSVPDHLNTWNSHHKPTGVFILFTLFCISAFVCWASGPYIWVGIQAGDLHRGQGSLYSISCFHASMISSPAVSPGSDQGQNKRGEWMRTDCIFIWSI